jgi:hypothetical protein
MKIKHLFRSISLLSVLVALAASQSSALASTPRQDSGPTTGVHLDNQSLLAAAAVKVGDTVTYAIDLQNLPAEGLTSVEYSCRYDATLVEISSLADAGLFGTDAVAALNGPSGGTFVYALAGVSKKASSAGTIFRFNLKALAAGSFSFDCKVRASKGAGLFDIAFSPTTININATAVNATITGKVSANGRPVTITLSGTEQIPVALTTNADGSFSLSTPAGNYTSLSAQAPGFLSAQRSNISLSSGGSLTLPTIVLLAGDINNDNKIDKTDVLTIGINYNKSAPIAGDLNNDGVINVLDLQLLAPNYGKTGPGTW